MGTGKKFSVRTNGLRLRTAKCGKTGKHSTKLYWYKRIGNREIYLRPADDLSLEPVVVCVECGKSFFRQRQNHRFCTPACAQRNRRKRQRLIKEHSPN